MFHIIHGSLLCLMGFGSEIGIYYGFNPEKSESTGKSQSESMAVLGFEHQGFKLVLGASPKPVQLFELNNTR